MVKILGISLIRLDKTPYTLENVYVLIFMRWHNTPPSSSFGGLFGAAPLPRFFLLDYSLIF
jgi:hypothetical protein